MALFKSGNQSGNPALGEKVFSKITYTAYGNDSLTIKGTLNKFGILFLLTMATAGFAWKMAASGVKGRNLHVDQLIRHIMPWRFTGI